MFIQKLFEKKKTASDILLKELKMLRFNSSLIFTAMLLTSCASYDHEVELKNYSINNGLDEIQANVHFVDTGHILQKHLLQLPGSGFDCKNEQGDVVLVEIGRESENTETKVMIQLCGNADQVNCQPVKFQLKRYTFKCNSFFTDMFHDLHKTRKPFLIDFDTRTLQNKL